VSRHIFIVEDDRDALSEMVECLVDEGFRVSTASSAEEMWNKIRRDPCHLFLLDIRLPGEDGLSTAKKIRKTSNVGIIFISGKADAVDRIVGLEIGADDYIIKPFTPKEVVARVKRVLSRTEMHIYPAPQHEQAIEARTLGFNGWRLELGSHSLFSPTGQEVPLTTAEFKLLKIFTLSPNRVLSRDYLLDHVHNQDWVGYDRGVDGLVSRLRKKLPTEAGTSENIKTIRGVGYMFTPTVDVDC